MSGARQTPLQNRVDPFGALVAVPVRGTLMGNRGGRIHGADRTLGTRRWASKAWICCRLAFNNRRRTVWGDSYTELFFLDEPTAFAAGHRPCFECRRADANAFAQAWARAQNLSEPPRAPDMDDVVHAERRDGRQQGTHRSAITELPDGAFVTFDHGPETPFAVRGDWLLRWSHTGYSEARQRPQSGNVNVLTPLHIVAVLRAGYQPTWHDSAWS